MTQEITKVELDEKSVDTKKLSKLSLFKSKEEMGIGDYIKNYTLQILAPIIWVFTISKIFIFIIHTIITYEYIIPKKSLPYHY